MKKNIFFIFLVINTGILMSQIQIGQSIRGESFRDQFGRAISMNNSGSVIAIGAPYNDSSVGQDAGHVRIYENKSGSWTKIGQDLDGEKKGDNSGYTVALNGEGNIVAIGAYNNDGNGTSSGHVRVYKLDGNTWYQLGGDIDGEAVSDWSSLAIDISNDGYTLAIGAPYNDANAIPPITTTTGNTGHVRVYTLDSGNNWVQKGGDLDGDSGNNLFGASVSLSDNGVFLAVGAILNNSNGFAASGQVKVFEFVNNAWTQLGSDIYGDDTNDRFGAEVKLNANGTVLATGASDGGYTRVYKIEQGEWNQFGDEISGLYRRGLDISSDGNTIGLIDTTVRIFKIRNDKWENEFEFIGSDLASLSFNQDASVVAIGIPEHNAGSTFTGNGHVKIYSLAADDTDTEAPVITSAQNADNLDENTGPNQLVYTITATDNEAVTGYAINGDDANYFKLNATTGTVQLLQNPDYETKASYTFQVTASDEVGNVSTPLTVTLMVNDLDDSPPFEQLGLDVDGGSSDNEFGNAVGLNASGTIMAVGALRNDDSGSETGAVKVYQYTNDKWQQLGSTIYGDAVDDLFGLAVSLNNTGDILAISAINNDDNTSNAGKVKVYKYESGNWKVIGTELLGISEDEYFGYSLKLNAAGNVLAVGAINTDNNGDNSGSVTVYEFSNNKWNQLGVAIPGVDKENLAGASLDLNRSGSRLAIGSSSYSTATAEKVGQVRVFEFQNSGWTQIGDAIIGQSKNDYLGFSVSLNEIGNLLAVGSYRSDANGTDSGDVKVYEYTSNNWSQLGSTISGENAGDHLGNAVVLNANGNVLVVGANYNDDNGYRAGHVQVYKNVFGEWTKIGDNINGEYQEDLFGGALSINNDGSILAAAARNNDGFGEDSGHVRVFKLFSDTTAPEITSSESATIEENSGENQEVYKIEATDNVVVAYYVIQGEDAAKFSLDKNTGAVTLIENPDFETKETYQFDAYAIDTSYNISDKFTITLSVSNANDTYNLNQINELIGEEVYDRFGRGLSYNKQGNILAVGSSEYDYPNQRNMPGKVRVFIKSNSGWNQLGNTIDGDLAGGRFGDVVSLNSEGNILAVGAEGIFNTMNSSLTSYVKVFHLVDKNWVQMGNRIQLKVNQLGYGRKCLSLNSDGNLLAIGGANDSVNVYTLIIDEWQVIHTTDDSHSREVQFGEGNRLVVSGRDVVGSPSKPIVSIYDIESNKLKKVGSFVGEQEETNFFPNSPTVSFSDEGNTLFVYHFEENNSGLKTYHFKNGQWKQKGSTVKFNFGKVASFSKTANVLAIGDSSFETEKGEFTGKVKLFKNINNNWVQIGEDINGVNAGDYAGIVQLNADGTELAIGGYGNDNTNGENAGHIRIFQIQEVDTEAPVITSASKVTIDENIGSNQEVYTITATDNVGVVSYAISGEDVNSFILNKSTGVVTLCENPDYEAKTSYTFSITASDNAGNISESVEVTLNIVDLHEEEVNFSQIGSAILGNNEYDKFGKLVKISKDGTTLVASSFDTGADNEGDCDYVKIYENINNSWQQKGSTLEFLCSYGYGKSLSINKDGSIIAVGISSMPQGEPTMVKVFEFQNDDWTQLGSDLQGDETSDHFANSISLNNNGTRLAVGVPHSSTNSVITGKIKVFEFVGTDWQQLGEDILGENQLENFGYSIDFDASGFTVVAGARYNDDNGQNAGQARIFQYDGTNWSQLGQDLNGEAGGFSVGDRFGSSVSINSNGSVVAIGAPYNNGNGNNSGHVRVFKYNGTIWEQMGDDINGTEAGDLSGWTDAVSLSDDGKTLAIGAYANSTFSGQVRVFKYNSKRWIQFGKDIYGEAILDYFGRTLSLSGDGSVLAIGGDRNDTNGEDAGHIKVYNLSGELKGNPISDDGLLAYYPFDGDVNDYSSNEYHGDLVGGTFTEDSSGNTNAALELDGVDDYVNLSSFATTYRDNTNKLSVYFKVKFNKTSKNQTILSLGNSGESLATNVFEIEYENKRLQIETEVGAATTNYELKIDEAKSLFDNQWHEILFTFDNDNLKYYRDGQLIFDDKYTPAVTETEDLFLGVFGGTHSNNCCYAGMQIDELQFYNTILDQSLLSIEEQNSISLSKNSITLFPNPVKDNLSIKINDGNIKGIEVFNLLGQVVYAKQNVNLSVVSFNARNLKEGTYYLRIKDQSNKVYIKNIIKK